MRGEAGAKKADLEANVIHYVLQYARIVNEILRVPRIPDQDARAKTKRLADVFKLCIQRNVDNALEGASTACCVHAGVKFEACRSLSRMLLASLKELKAFLRDEHGDAGDVEFSAFVEKNLSSKALGPLWSMGSYTSTAFKVAFAVAVLVLAYQYNVFPAAARMLHLDPGTSSRVWDVLSGAAGSVAGGVGAVRAALVELLRPVQDALSISSIMAAGTSLGAGVSDGVSQFFSGTVPGALPAPQPGSPAPASPVATNLTSHARRPDGTLIFPADGARVPVPSIFGSRAPIDVLNSDADGGLHYKGTVHKPYKPTDVRAFFHEQLPDGVSPWYPNPLGTSSKDARALVLHGSSPHSVKVRGINASRASNAVALYAPSRSPKR